MRAETKVQIKAIKKGNYMIGRAGSTVMISEGHYIVYMPEKDCMVDVSKMKGIPEDAVKRYSPDEIGKQMKPIGLTKKAVVLSDRMARLFENKETGTRAWIDDRYVKMFQSYSCNYVEIGGETDIVFTNYGRIVGLVLSVRVPEEYYKEK